MYISSQIAIIQKKMFYSLGFNFLIISIICLTKIETSLQIDSIGLYESILNKTANIIGICPTIPNRILTFVLYNNRYSTDLENQLYIYDTEQELKADTLDLIYLNEMKPLKDKWPELYAQIKSKISLPCLFPMTVVIHKPERVLIGCSDKSDNTTVFHFKLDEPTKVSVIVSNDVFGFGITTWIDKSSMFYALNIQPQPIYSTHPVDKLTQFGTFELNNDQIHMVGKRFYFDLNDKNANSYVVKPESIQNEEVRELHGYNQPSKAELNVDTIVCGFVDSTSARIIMYSKNPPVITFDWKSIDSIKPRASEIDIHIEGKSTVKTKVKQYDLNKLIKFGKAPKSIFGRSTTIIASVTSLILILCLCGFIVCFFIFYRKESKPTEPRLDGNESKVNQSNVNVSTTSKKGSYVSTPSKVRSNNRTKSSKRSQIASRVDKSSSKLGRSVSKQRSGSLIASKNRSAVRSKSHLTKCDSATRGDKALVKNITARKSSKTKLIGRNSSSKKGSQKSRSKTTK